MNDSLESPETCSEETLHGRYLTFQVGKEMYGIQIRYVIEIVGLQPVTVMPEMPEYIKGVINLRGKIISIMDIRLRFSLPSKEYDDRTCIIVIDMNGVSVGLVIDSVSDVLTIGDNEIMKKPEMSTKVECDYISSLGKKDDQVILLIDCEKLLNKSEIDQVS